MTQLKIKTASVNYVLVIDDGDGNLKLFVNKSKVVIVGIYSGLSSLINGFDLNFGFGVYSTTLTGDEILNEGFPNKFLFEYFKNEAGYEDEGLIQSLDFSEFALPATEITYDSDEYEQLLEDDHEETQD